MGEFTQFKQLDERAQSAGPATVALSGEGAPNPEGFRPLPLTRESMRFAASALRSAVDDAGDDDLPPVWFRFGYLIEVADMLERASDALHPVAAKLDTPTGALSSAGNPTPSSENFNA